MGFQGACPKRHLLSLVGTFNGWKEDGSYNLHPEGGGDWVMSLKKGSCHTATFTSWLSDGEAAAATVSPPMPPAPSRMKTQRSSQHRYGSPHRAT